MIKTNKFLQQVIIFTFSLLVIAIGLVVYGGQANAISGASTYFPDTSPAGQAPSYAIVQVTGSLVRSSSGVLNAQTKMKARSTIANIYVPKTLENQVISLSIVNGCGGTIRDNNSFAGSTTFAIHNVGIIAPSPSLMFTNTSNPACAFGPHIPISFVATPNNPAAPDYFFSRTYSDGVEYNIYQFTANGFMIEAGSSNRYLNAFGLQTITPGALVGISDIPVNCDKINYPISCPDERWFTDVLGRTTYGSKVYTSFYGPSPAFALPNYNQQIKIRNSCTSTASISLYDLDASDTTGLSQPNMRIYLRHINSATGASEPIPVTMLNGGTYYELPLFAIQNWSPGIAGVMRAHAPFGGNNNQYMDIPGGDPTFTAAANFLANESYTLNIDDIDSDNAIQILPTIDHCPAPIPDICTNIPGNQATVPTPYTDPDGDQICDQPDSAPVITLTPVCNNVAGSYYINVATSDADGGTSTVSYSGTGFVAGSQASNSFNLPRNPTATVTLSASTNGVYPTYYRSAQSGSAGPTTFPPCIYSFTLGASSSVPTLDDNEQPTNVNSVTFTTTYSSTSPNGVRAINSNKQMYVLKAGVLNLPYLIGPEIVNVNFTAGAVDTRNNFSLVGRNLSAGDAVCSLYNINRTSGYVDTNGNLINNSVYPLAGASGNTAQCQRIVNRPYLKVYGSDIMAGTGFGTNCTASTTNVIGSAKRLAVAPNNWVGAGTQLGVFANGFVDSFASSSILSPNLPSSKVFANNLTVGPAAVINNVFGGGYNSKFCDDDFWATKATSVTAAGGAIPALHALASGQYQYDAGAIINSAPIDLTSRIAIYVDGDITINTNIRMAATAAASPDSLPSFYVIVRGNIYITPGVTRLDGVYVAQPRNPATTLGTPADGGRIFTCADAGTAPSAATLTGPCITNKLTVNGSFSAVRINFLRGGGSLRAALAGELGTSANIAEVFNFLPESLLGIPAPSVTTLGQYDSVISLPPGL